MRVERALLFFVLVFAGIVCGGPWFEPVKPWADRENPGVCFTDAWGWHGAIWYQREYETGASFEYMTDKVIDESYHCGSNLLELFPRKYFSKHTGGQGKYSRREIWPWAWEEDVIGFAKMEDWYENAQDPRWNNDSFRMLNRYTHQKNMLMQWFCHPELPQNEVGGQPVFKDMKKIKASAKLIEALGAMFANATTCDWMDMYDGFGHEHWFWDLDGITLGALWEYNPGHYCFSMNHCTKHPEDEPSYAEALSCGPTGRDDQLILPDTYGRVYLCQQANSRSRKPPAEEWGYTVYGGFAHPDWLVKQTNDFFRGRLYANGKPDATAIWWLGEPGTTMPDEYRQYVYGSCMDPMKCAAAGTMLATGVSGRLDIIGEMHDVLGGRDLGMDAERTQCPASGYFIQNNYLKVEIEPNKGYSKLLYDPSHSGHFDDDSNAVVIADKFVEFYCDGKSLEGPAELELVECLKSESKPFDLVVAHADIKEGTFPAVLEREVKKGDIHRRTLYITGDLSAGKYHLKLFVLKDKLKSKVSVTAKLGERFLETVVISKDESVYDVAFAVPVSNADGITLFINEGVAVPLEKIEILKEKRERSFVHSLKVVEPAGHYAALEMTSYLVDEKGESQGTINTVLRMVADQPYMAISQGVDGFDGMGVGSKMRLADYMAEKGNGQFICNSDGAGPKFFVAVAGKQGVDAMDWDGDDKSLAIDYKKSKKRFYSSSIGLVDFLSGADDKDIRKGMWARRILVEPGKEGAEYKLRNVNKPVVSMVRVMNPAEKPYYVREYGADGKAWWYFRGAQPSKEQPGTDLLRLYVMSDKTVKVMFDGFIDGLARPGWGSQYSLLLGDVEKSDCGGSLKAKVVSLTPFIFAPRVQFDGMISSVEVNGKSWAYFDNDVVFLPLEKGVYDVKVKLGEKAKTPHLTRTAANVEACYYDEDSKSLKINWKMPEGTKMPGDLLFSANINSGSGSKCDSVDVCGGELVRSGLKGCYRANIKLQSNDVSVSFK